MSSLPMLSRGLGMASGHRPRKRRSAAVALAGALLSAAIAMPSPAALASRTSAAAPPGSGPAPASSELAQAPPALRAAALRTLPWRRRGAAAPGTVAGLESDELGGSVAVSGSTAVIGATGVDNGAGAAYTFTRSSAGWRLRTVLTDPPNFPGDLFGGSVAISGPTLIIGALGANGGPGAPDKGNTDAGAAYVYVRSGASWRLRATLRDPRGRAGDVFGTSVALSGTIALVGAPGSGSQQGRAYVYTRSAGRWSLQATLAGTGQTRADIFGNSVALSGTTAVIGAPDAGGTRGTAYVFTRSAARWPLVATLPDPRSRPGDNAGWSVAASAAAILVGAPGVRSSTGATFVYAPQGTGWRLQATLMRGNGAEFSSFGWSVTIAGSRAVVGAFLADAGNGAVFIYGRSGTAWRWQAALMDPDTGGVFDDFGGAVQASGSTIVIGADGNNDLAGAAYVYALSGTRWRRQAALIDPRGHPGKNEGGSVAISGATAVVGAWGLNGASGGAYIYRRSAGRWHLQASLSDPVAGPSLDRFGAAVAVSGSTVLVGAWGTNLEFGDVYVYVQSGGHWHLQSRIAEPRGLSDGTFGSAVAISGDTALIGAEGAHDFTGAAFVYVRSGSRWHQQAKLPAPHGAAGVNFGEAVALSGTTALIGATCDDNCAGAAYVYARSGRRWRLQASLTDPDGQPNDGFGTSLALSGPTAVIGAPGVRDNTGAAYVYGRSRTRWQRRAVLLIPRRGDVSGGFGGAVAATGTGPGTVALISGLSVSGLARERNQCGSAFEFSRPGGRWHERARVADPRCSTYDEFGFAVAASGGTALIGAPGADGNTGAAYLLTLLPPQTPRPASR